MLRLHLWSKLSWTEIIEKKFYFKIFQFALMHLKFNLISACACYTPKFLWDAFEGGKFCIHNLWQTLTQKVHYLDTHTHMMSSTKMKTNQIGTREFFFFRIAKDNCHELEFGNLPRGREKHEKTCFDWLHAASLEGSGECFSKLNWSKLKFIESF